MGKWEREGEGERVSLNRRHLEKAHWLWSWLTGPSYLVSHLFRLYAEIKPFSSSNSSFIFPSEMTEPTRPATFCRDTGKLIIASCNFLLASSTATTSGNQRDWRQIHVLFYSVFSFLTNEEHRRIVRYEVEGGVFFRFLFWCYGSDIPVCLPCFTLWSLFCLVPFSHVLPLSFFLSCDCLPHPDWFHPFLVNKVVHELVSQCACCHHLLCVLSVCFMGFVLFALVPLWNHKVFFSFKVIQEFKERLYLHWVQNTCFLSLMALGLTPLIK